MHMFFFVLFFTGSNFLWWHPTPKENIHREKKQHATRRVVDSREERFRKLAMDVEVRMVGAGGIPRTWPLGCEYIPGEQWSSAPSWLVYKDPY